MFAEDGTTGLNPQGNPISQEGCNPLINDLTGKIAVIWRNTCEFGAKAAAICTIGTRPAHAALIAHAVVRPRT